MFFFFVGVEVDIGVMKKYGKVSGIIFVVGMILFFGLGVVIVVFVYYNFVDMENVFFGYFLLFVGVVMVIIVFFVLCWILMFIKFIDICVGVMVLVVGVGNDVVGWVFFVFIFVFVNF